MTKKTKKKIKIALEIAFWIALKTSKIVYKTWAKCKDPEESEALHNIVIKTNYTSEMAAKALWAYEDLIKKYEEERTKK